jgi:P-type E1-E2 ATPase
VDTVLLDKTGTLTRGTPQLPDVHAASGTAATTLLRTAAIAESRSEHPIAKAIPRNATQLGIPYEDPAIFEYTSGKGIIARNDGEEIIVGNQHFLLERGIQFKQEDGSMPGSEIFVAGGGRFLGTLKIADTLRPEAKNAIRSLKSMGLRTVLLTGDAKTVAEDVGHKLAVDEIVSDLLPEGKLQYVRLLTERGHKAAMVGDGVNDAPALMQASVGVAMGSGTDVARESAGVVLIGSDLSKLVETLQTARRCRRTIMQTFVGTLVVDGIGVGLAAFGFLNPLLAAFLHVSSEMAFILNSARLLPAVSSANQFVRGILSQSPSTTN